MLAYGLSALACLVAIMWQSECDPRDMAAHDYAKFKMKPHKMMEYVSKPAMLSTVSERQCQRYHMADTRVMYIYFDLIRP